jgi:hypothetical protein
MNELSVWSGRLRVGRLQMSGDGLTFLITRLAQLFHREYK